MTTNSASYPCIDHLTDRQSQALLTSPIAQMCREELNSLSYIFRDNVAFPDFESLLVYFLARMPDSEQIWEFWEEVEDLEYY